MKYLATLLLLIATLAHAQVPDAPKPQPFFASTTNSALVSAEVNVRFLDAYSTLQRVNDPCGCYREAGHFYGISLAPVASTSAGQYAYSLGMAAANTEVAALIWHHAEHSHHRRLYRALSRAVMASDITVNAWKGPVTNWMQQPKFSHVKVSSLEAQ